MSSLKVPLTYIKEILPHPNAERLEIAKVYDSNVIVPLGVFKAGDEVIYIPDSAVLSEKLESILFEPGSKITLHNRRLRAIKIRGVVSQGMIVNPTMPEIMDMLEKCQPKELAMDSDLSEYLGVTKYSPPVSSLPGLMQTNPNANPYKVKEFKEYTDIEHGKYYDRVLQDGEMVVITQKLHGTSARYGYFPRPAISLLDKARKFLGLLPGWQFCWGSRRSQIQSKPGKSHPGFKSDKHGVDFGDVYTKIAAQENLRFKIPRGYSVYGEIVGWGIQKGYLYNCGLNKHDFYVYDVMYNGNWLDYVDMVGFCIDYNLKMVPQLYYGPYSKEKVDEMLIVNKISLEVAEGVVVGPVIERSSSAIGRVKLKYINPEYLVLKNNTEFQ